MINMQTIQPSVAQQDILCAEIPAPPSAMVVFGASGDLTSRKLLPSIFQIFSEGLLHEKFYLLGSGRKKLTDEDFREVAQKAIRSKFVDVSTEDLNSFTDKLYYVDGDYTDAAFYKHIKTRLGELEKKHKVGDNLLFYLAIPPFLYTTVVSHLGSADLVSCGFKLIVEKPFGRDLKSAAELNDNISQCFNESQIYRIDHYLGKETVQNILMFRFANSIFEPLWNRNYIDHIQITIAEKLGVEHRGSFYDSTGALRDIFQNHMLAILTLVAMEPPASFEADHIRDEKVKLLCSIRPFKTGELKDVLVRGQYGQGKINGQKVPDYRSEPGIAPQSRTETFVAAKLFIDNWRWKGVPFYLRTGKRLSKKDTEINIIFKKVPHSMFVSSGIEDLPANILTLQIQPEEGISLSFQAKRPGSKMCMGTLNMNFCYKDVFGVSVPEAYQRLLLDCMIGDQTLFTRYDSVEIAWNLLTPVIEALEKEQTEPHIYPAGSDSFAEADRLIEADGRKWRKFSEL
jgi:glucose-6-phosphate 1-dehydrogenase